MSHAVGLPSRYCRRAGNSRKFLAWRLFLILLTLQHPVLNRCSASRDAGRRRVAARWAVTQPLRATSPPDARHQHTCGVIRLSTGCAAKRRLKWGWRAALSIAPGLGSQRRQRPAGGRGQTAPGCRTRCCRSAPASRPAQPSPLPVTRSVTTVACGVASGAPVDRARQRAAVLSGPRQHLARRGRHPGPEPTHGEQTPGTRA